MSEHEVEDLVENSIRVLHRRHRHDDERVRSWIATLWGFQRGYDCKFTHFRVMDVLLSRRYTFRFELDQHPDYFAYQEYFDGLTEFEFLAEVPGRPEHDWASDDEATGEEYGYVEPPGLYCDTGGELWRRMVELGRLAGSDAATPVPVPLHEAVNAVLDAAEGTGDQELIATWQEYLP